jgi:hypothetical protein
MDVGRLAENLVIAGGLLRGCKNVGKMLGGWLKVW